MTMVFDSSVLISHLRGQVPATDLLLSMPTAERLVSVLTRVEIEGGMRSGERSDFAELFSAVTLVPVSDAMARQAGRLLRQFRRSHAGIDLVDYVIAATAQLRDARLATLNVRHFPMFSQLVAPW